MKPSIKLALAVLPLVSLASCGTSISDSDSNWKEDASQIVIRTTGTTVYYNSKEYSPLSYKEEYASNKIAPVLYVKATSKNSGEKVDKKYVNAMWEIWYK